MRWYYILMQRVWSWWPAPARVGLPPMIRLQNIKAILQTQSPVNADTHCCFSFPHLSVGLDCCPLMLVSLAETWFSSCSWRRSSCWVGLHVRSTVWSTFSSLFQRHWLDVSSTVDWLLTITKQPQNSENRKRLATIVVLCAFCRYSFANCCQTSKVPSLCGFRHAFVTRCMRVWRDYTWWSGNMWGKAWQA